LNFEISISSSQSAISVDGKTLYANTFTGNGNFITGNVIAYDVASGERKQIFSLPAQPSALTNPEGPAAGRYIALSPDGNTLAVIRRPPGPDPRLALVGVNGDEYREIVISQGTLRTVAWTRDSRSILYTTLKPDTADTWLLMQIPARGGDAVFTGLEITGLSYLDVSPDGSRIAFDGTAVRIEEQSK
jgi:Tol biopolymer transport system component